MGKTRWKQ